MSLARAALLCLALVAFADVRADDDPWRIPTPDACRTEPARLLTPPPPGKDAPPVTPPMPGDSIGAESAARLRDFLPPEIWEKRERFFYDGMHMKIGPCFRDYSPPEFFSQATRELSAGVTLDAEGTLHGHKAGLPFPPASLSPDDPDAGLKWAWNAVSSYNAAGKFGSIQISLVNEKGVAEQWRGDYFQLDARGRADRPSDGYAYAADATAAWIAGGVTRNLRTGNECAFRQFQNGGRKPDLFMASSHSRKIARVPPPDSEYPLTGCIIDAAVEGGGLFIHGFEPRLHRWKVRGVADVLAPINASKPNWPVAKDRNYGPWGISFADDRWELRRVIVLEGELREGKFEDNTQRFTWYLDLQTLQLLYYAGFKANGDAQGVGYWVRRWSEDSPDYPRWSDDPERPVRALDVIGSALVDWGAQHAVRADTGDAVAVPKDDAKLRRQLSIGSARVH